MGRDEIIDRTFVVSLQILTLTSLLSLPIM